MDVLIKKPEDIIVDSFKKNGYAVVPGVLRKEDITPVFDELINLIIPLVSSIVISLCDLSSFKTSCLSFFISIMGIDL